ncbi:MAG TPA: 16S rRNA (cytosine(967)-C(5))-methyltransferase RsmB [Solirubrobacteraceae bacterium]|nr:16S rRNA (cytosine(967)-C(5))-methyltransferase RsmB [Solirubrobacteraceae bacterium]
MAEQRRGRTSGSAPRKDGRARDNDGRARDNDGRARDNDGRVRERERAPAQIAPARKCAYATLRAVAERGAYADRALQANAGELDARDRALAMRLVYGTVQRQGTLDYLIAKLAERPAERVDVALLLALRVGLYELLYLGGAPDHAIVADAVELAKQAARSGHGLVNAVLRRATREGRELLGALSDETPAEAAVMHSHPEWVVRLWWEALGAESARGLLAQDNEPSELALRANTLVSDLAALAAGIAAPSHTDAQLPEALVLDGPFDVHGSELWRAGACVAQSRGAMLVARVVGPQPGERVLDLCAAPGGKTTHMAALMQAQGEIVAVERNAARAGALLRTVGRLRAANVRVERADASEQRREGAVFDRVLVDPPCSGLGTLQARADLRWRVTPAAIGQMVGEQRAILEAGAAGVRPGGVLVYSTCTISPAENEDQIAAFLQAHPDFTCDELGVELPVFVHPRDSRFVLTQPHIHHTAGFFIARMRRALVAGAEAGE